MDAYNPPQDQSHWLQSPTLTGRFLVLEALTPQHAPDIQAAATPETVQFLARGGPQANTVPEWEAYIERLNALPKRVNWAVMYAGRAVGRISFSEVNQADHWAEIGTMLLPPVHGTVVNPEAKLLLMTRAFEVLGMRRVHFKVDSRNERSLRAMQKLGAVQEGVLRQYQRRPDGHARDSVVFSVLAGEWEQVKAGLLGRLER